MRDVSNGWLIRYLHANTASFFFIFVYIHIGRGLYYGSYKAPRELVWWIGVVILVLMMATAFLGLITCPIYLDFNLINYDINLVYDVISTTVILPTITSSRSFTILKVKAIEAKVVFEDLDKKRKIILLNHELSNIAPIYNIINLINGKVYIGSATTGKVISPLRAHLISDNKGNVPLRHPVLKYGINNFAFILLEILTIKMTGKYNKKLIALQDFHIKNIHPEYNINPNAANSYGLIRSEESRVKCKAYTLNRASMSEDTKTLV